MVVTIYHKGYDADTRMETWSRNAYEATVYSDNKINVESGGVSSADIQKIRIFTRGAVTVADDDRVVLGTCTEEAPPGNSKKVTSWSDNRNPRLTKKTWHWRITCV